LAGLTAPKKSRILITIKLFLFNQKTVDKKRQLPMLVDDFLLFLRQLDCVSKAKDITC
jgi:hypothetical protein